MCALVSTDRAGNPRLTRRPQSNALATRGHRGPELLQGKALDVPFDASVLSTRIGRVTERMLEGKRITVNTTPLQVEVIRWLETSFSRRRRGRSTARCSTYVPLTFQVLGLEPLCSMQTKDRPPSLEVQAGHTTGARFSRMRRMGASNRGIAHQSVG